MSATLLVDGQVAGTWRTTRERQTLTITLQPFAPLSPNVLDECQREGASLASFTELQAVKLEIAEGYKLEGK